MKTLSTDFTPLILALVLIAGTQSLLQADAKSGESIVGEWISDSLANFGTTTAEFSGDGTCRFRESRGEQFSCTWTQVNQGQIRIAFNSHGKNGVFLAGMTGDRLTISEPGREPQFVRAESKLAYERQMVGRPTH